MSLFAINTSHGLFLVQINLGPSNSHSIIQSELGVVPNHIQNRDTNIKENTAQTTKNERSQKHKKVDNDANNNKDKNEKYRPYQCNLCKKRFTQRHSLNDHIRLHTGEKPYQCDICHKRFTVRYNCKVHRRIHTGEKPYECSMCNKRFASKSGLNSHFKRMHSK